MNIGKCSYKDLPPIILENETLQVSVILKYGTKTGSIFTNIKNTKSYLRNQIKISGTLTTTHFLPSCIKLSGEQLSPSQFLRIILKTVELQDGSNC